MKAATFPRLMSSWKARPQTPIVLLDSFGITREDTADAVVFHLG